MLSTIWSSRTVALLQHATHPEPGVFDDAHQTFARCRVRDVSGDDLDPHPAALRFRYGVHVSASGAERPFTTTIPAPCSASQRAATKPTPPMPPTTM